MRSVQELTPADFPGLDAAKFEEWKQARKEADSKAKIKLLVLLGIVVLNVILFVAMEQFVIPGLLPLILIMFIGLKAERNAGRLWKEVGLTRQALKEARSRSGPPVPAH